MGKKAVIITTKEAQALMEKEGMNPVSEPTIYLGVRPKASVIKLRGVVGGILTRLNLWG